MVTRPKHRKQKRSPGWAARQAARGRPGLPGRGSWAGGWIVRHTAGNAVTGVRTGEEEVAVPSTGQRTSLHALNLPYGMTRQRRRGWKKDCWCSRPGVLCVTTCLSSWRLRGWVGRAFWYVVGVYQRQKKNSCIGGSGKSGDTSGGRVDMSCTLGPSGPCIISTAHRNAILSISLLGRPGDWDGLAAGTVWRLGNGLRRGNGLTPG